jgi:hypothetical protein
MEILVKGKKKRREYGKDWGKEGRRLYLLLHQNS